MTTTEREKLFDHYFRNVRTDLHPRFRGRLNLKTFKIKELADAFEKIKKEINERWDAQAARIQSPNGKVQLHLDYLEATEINALAFSYSGIHFVAITDKMLAHFRTTCEALWRLNLLGELLGVDLNTGTRDFLFQAALMLQLQFISSHELGHHFHGHVGSRAFYEEFDAEFALDAGNMRRQPREVEADGYAVHLLLDNLIGGTSGNHIHRRLGSSLNPEECILRLLLLSIGSLFFFLDAGPFDARLVRHKTHPFALARMNVVMHDLEGWQSLNISKAGSWATLKNFQRVMDCVQQAAADANLAETWKQQSQFLNSSAGTGYIQDLYAEREKLRVEMTPRQWKLTSE